MSIDLQRFCANELDPREHLRAPWLFGEWVYATNGHLAVRVPAASRPDITATPEKAPKAEPLFTAAFERAGEFLQMPNVEKKRCPHCRGAGRLHAIPCTGCDKKRLGEFEHDGHWYDCQTCVDSPAGAGWLDVEADHPRAQPRPCDPCDGLGLQRDDTPTRIGDAIYATRYVAMLSDLPSVRIKAGDPASEQWSPQPVAAALIFDGGQALLMPRRA